MNREQRRRGEMTRTGSHRDAVSIGPARVEGKPVEALTAVLRQTLFTTDRGRTGPLFTQL